MRILEKGEDQVYIKRCCKCNSLIEFEITEVQHNSFFNRDEVDCPVCNTGMLLFPSDLFLRKSESSKQIAEECLQDIKS